MNDQPLRGLFAAVLTPIRDDGSLDTALLSSHAASLLSRGCHGVSLFGTTGEGPAFTVDERMEGLEAVLRGGVARETLLPATGCAALPDTLRLTRHALDKGCSTILLMPPFFFKDLGDDDVFAFFAKVIEEINETRLRLYLYNFPAVTGVRISPAVIARLLGRYPDVIAGVKDSSGDWDYMQCIRQTCPELALFTGWEVLLPKLLAIGGVGNISGIANVTPELLRDLYDRKPVAEDDKVLQGVERMVETVTSLPVTPALKSLACDLYDIPSWKRVRVPYQALETSRAAALLSEFKSGRDATGL